MPRKVDVREIILCHHQTTARFFIQSMNNARSFFPADTGKIFAMRKQSVNQRPASVAGTRMNRHSGGFVYDDEIVVFKQDGELDVFRGEVDRFNGRFDQSNVVARSNHITRTRSSSIYRYVTLANKRLNSRTGKFRRGFGEKTIQACAGIRGRDIEFAAVSLGH